MSAEEREIRNRIREELMTKGINPYPHSVKFVVTPVKEVIANPKVGAKVAVAGRVMAVRKHGKISFIDLVDDGVRIQLVLRKDVVGDESYKWFHHYIGAGDIIAAYGTIFYTKRGELSIEINDYQLLAKALRSPPVRYGHRLLDPEVRYRKRYLDIMCTPQVREILEKKFMMVQEIRKFMWSRGYIEVETPVLQPIYGGAEARPFKTRVWALDEDWYLRISLELYLKRYIVAGFNKVFEIGKNFRNEDIDAQHNPEFTMMEAYEAYADYNDMMRLTEDLVTEVAWKINKSLKAVYTVDGEEVEIDLRKPWRRVRLVDALREEADLDVERMSDEEIRKLLKEHGITLKGGYCRGYAIIKLFDKLVGRKIVEPTFVIDYPADASPLCKPHREDPRYAERFELYIAGMELANAYTELNDPVLQDKYFKEQEERRKKGDEEAHPYDKDFVEALEYGMPPTGGLGLGIDRLAMVLLGATSIKEIIPYPMLKRSGTP